MKYQLVEARFEQDTFSVPNGSIVLKVEKKGEQKDIYYNLIVEPGGFYVQYLQPLKEA